MPYHLKPDESVTDGLKRVVREEIDEAAKLNSEETGDRGQAIHEARKSIKKVRAVLRLIQPELGAQYRRENQKLRDVGRELSEFRDAVAIFETFEALTGKYREDMGRQPLGPARRALIDQKDKAEQGSEVEGVLEDVATTLRGIGEDVDSWPLKKDGFSAIAPGLENTYRRGRKALSRAKKRPLAKNFHEWRKRVKYHWYHVRLLEHTWTEAMQAYERDLKDLETWLGDDHNLVVLHDKIQADPQRYGPQKDIDLLLDLIGRYQRELREKAIELGERIYQDRPRLFGKRMEVLWAAWKARS